jgi:PAS domain S-box-containing protein
VDLFARIGPRRGGSAGGDTLRWILSALVVLALLGMGWGITIWAGGSDKVTLNWFYIPILVAAMLLGPTGTAVAAILAAIIAGPLTPADSRLHLWEPPSLWILRGVFYLGIGLFAAWVIELRRRTERKLQAAQAAYRNLVEQLPGVVYVSEFGGQGDWLYVSPGIERLLGYTPEEWLGHPHPFRSHVHPQDYLWILQQEVLSRTSGEPMELEYRMRRRDGSWIRVRDTASVVYEADGEPLWMQGVLADEGPRAEAARPETARRRTTAA